MNLSLKRAVALGWVLGIGLWTSAAEFQVDHSRSTLEVLVGATGDDFAAKLERFETSIQVDRQSGRPTAGTFTWDFKDLKTGKKGRDKEMLHWLGYDKTPQGVFTFRKCEEKDGNILLTGDVKIHGVTNSITLPLNIVRNGSQLTWNSGFSLDHREFGLSQIEKLVFLKVDPVLKLRFTLAGTIKE
jgi:polyisoprenoid-binding protein YceI